MTPQKILIGQIIVVLAIIVAATSAATQWAAHMLEYQTALGPAWFSVGATLVYYPWWPYEWRSRWPLSRGALAYIAGYGIRAYLIAQSFNPITRHYGETNSILDNCQVRIACAANDDRTARRISDCLGTATELRAQRNYAGHRLAPWLSHVMVSRQEIARSLLTPGEVMQLPTKMLRRVFICGSHIGGWMSSSRPLLSPCARPTGVSCLAGLTPVASY